ncbi:MAG: sulfite exporter TauE/SafE family protein [Gemmatimonadaceae bacterium]|nr:sulfite exporter TauE/SafE family protein [Gemmatimonadaceae bacterium]
MYWPAKRRGIGGCGARAEHLRYSSARSRAVARDPRGAPSFLDPRSPVTLALAAPLPVGRLLVAALAALLAGVINSVAGGGTLLTFPSLIAAGLSPLAANATSTVALLPASLSAMHGYRGELTGARRWAVGLALPSLVGGGAGALLLLHTSNATFERVVPWLVLGATALFLIQRPLLRRVRRHDEGVGAGIEPPAPSPAMLAEQFLVGIYGGYFGAGVGIITLAVLGFMGFSNIHRMNGLKNWGGFCMNLVAAATFAVSGIVDWPVALSMAVGSIAGGYLGARGAQRLPQGLVRGVVATIGLGSGIWLLLR